MVDQSTNARTLLEGQITAILDERKGLESRIEDLRLQCKVLDGTESRLRSVAEMFPREERKPMTQQGVPGTPVTAAVVAATPVRLALLEFLRHVEGQFTTEQAFQAVAAAVTDVKRDVVLNAIHYERRKKRLGGNGEGVYWRTESPLPNSDPPNMFDGSENEPEEISDDTTPEGE